MPVAPVSAAVPAAADAPRPAGPAAGTVVARVVFDGMPGEGVYEIAKGAPLAPGHTWGSLSAARRAVAKLTAGDDVLTAGIFHRNGRYEAYSLTTGDEGSTTHDGEYWAQWSDNVCRTVAGRGLSAIIDGDEQPGIMDADAFRKYQRYAGE